MGDGIFRQLAIANMVLGCIVVLFQLAMLITLHDWVDWICIGFWGGGLMVLTGMWTLQKSQKKMIATASLAMVSGLCMVGFYSWNVSIVDCSDVSDDRKNKSNWEEDSDLCDWRQASDILFIIFGCLTIGLNMFLAAKASTLVGERSQHHPAPVAQSLHHQPAPTHTTYVTTTPAYPAPYPQSHQYPPSGPPPPAGYPAYPPHNQPAYNPGYPPQQQYYKD